MKPLRIFIFCAVVTLLLFLLALIIPRQGIFITPGLHLKFMDLSDLSVKDTVDRDQMVEQLVAASNVTEDPEAGDTLSFPAVLPANVDSLKQDVYRIQFAEENPSVLHPFFRNLDQISLGNKRHGRIIHFGDSQIENDRMTALIRYRMQRNFGGTGTGLVQAIPLYSGSLSYQQEESGAWLRYTYFGRRDSTIMHKSYGIMGAFASVPTPEEDTWPMLYYRFNTSRRSGQVRRIQLFLHSYVDGAS
ncbi:MAG: hypothetical protein KAS29_05285, partial [Bacteroidales bacterium]|nr:hypothetical protein [Bacteroidales bacterium]